MNIGVIGCGNINEVYLSNFSSLFKCTHVTACADLDRRKAEAVAKDHSGIRAISVDELLSDPEIELILNLTNPQAHFSVSLSVLEAGKHVYSEKPLALTRAEGEKLLEKARERNLYLGCAPDTFLGASQQSVRKIIDDGWIGTPFAAVACMMCPGHEHWHPDPEFYYKRGGGPLFDMGPYYLSSLINLFGSVRQVIGYSSIVSPVRVIQSEPKKGQEIEVEVPTHVSGLMKFENGCVATLLMSFDVVDHGLPFIEIYGPLGTLRVPDPNFFSGDILVRLSTDDHWESVPDLFGYGGNARGLGVAEMIAAIEQNTLPRANGDLAFHVLDVMQTLHAAAEDERFLSITSQTARPEPMIRQIQY